MSIPENVEKRDTDNIVEALLFNAKLQKHLHQEKESETKSSDIMENTTHLIPFTTCVRTLPFLENLSRKNSYLLIFNSLKSIYYGRLSPSHMLEYYHYYCTCALE